MSDPLSEVVTLLRPRAALANVISGRGNWAIHYSKFGRPSFCIMLQGSCLLAVSGHRTITLSTGDFVLLPTTPAFTISSVVAGPPVHMDPHRVAGGRSEVRYGERRGPPDMRSLGGSFQFDSADPRLLISLLPEVVHVCGSQRLSQLVAMVGEETLDPQPGGDFMRSRIMELLLIEAIRSAAKADAPPGLLRGLADKRLARVLNQVHARLDRTWTVNQMAKAAALSRSTFFDRFSRVVGAAPMEYLLAWRIEVAKDLLHREGLPVATVAERVGYGSASAFSVAFSRQVGQPPSRFAQNG